MNRKIFYIFICLFVFSFDLFCISPKFEIRAVWLTTNWALDWPDTYAVNAVGIQKQQNELYALLDEIKAMNINTVFFQTRLRGDVLYPSKYEPWASVLTGKPGRSPGYDPLAFAIAACHERGLECHAWMVCMPVGSQKQVNEQGTSSVVNKHPSWCKKVKGEWYLDPGNPGVPLYIKDMVNEIVSRYNIDGIHLDYIRYSDEINARFDAESYKKYNRKNLSLKEWRAENITSVVSLVFDEVKRIKPWVKVSSSPLGKYNSLQHYPAEGWSCMESVCQDVQLWLKLNKQDFVAPMMYFNDQAFYPFLYDWVANRMGKNIVAGLGIYRMNEKESDWSLNDITRQISLSREMGAQGQAYYRLEQLIDNEKGLKTELMSDYYRYPALVPSIGEPRTVQKPNLIVTAGTDKIDLKWNYNPEVKGYVIYGATGQEKIDIENPSNIRKIVFNDTGFISRDKSLSRFAVSALDYFGNESEPAFADVTEGIKAYNNEVYICPVNRMLKLNGFYDDIRVITVSGKEICRDARKQILSLENLPAGYYNLILQKERKIEKKLLIIR